MKVQTTTSGKVEFSRFDIIKILNEVLKKEKGFTANSFIFEVKDGKLTRALGQVDCIEGDQIDDQYHTEPERRNYPQGTTRPNYGFTGELRVFLKELSKVQSHSQTVMFNFGDAKKHFFDEFPKLTEDVLRKYLVRGDMQEGAKITILNDGDNYIGTIL